jgi:hypothetical protein
VGVFLLLEKKKIIERMNNHSRKLLSTSPPKRPKRDHRLLKV